MKKLLLILIIVLLLTGCSYNKTYISKIINVNLDDCVIEKENDTHGGFLGDGEYFAKLTCSKSLENILNSNWKKFPLTEEIINALEIEWCDKEGCLNYFERTGIDKLINGYYYFLDRHSDSLDKFDSSMLNERASYNFSLGIYDLDNNNIYYYELDT